MTPPTAKEAMMTDPETIARLAAAATPGPWNRECVFSESFTEICQSTPPPDEANPCVIATTFGDEGRHPNEEGAAANAAFMCAAHDMAALIAHQSAELERMRKALHDAATSLETISRLAGKKHCPEGIDTFMDSFIQTRAFASNRAVVARAALNPAQMGEDHV